MIDGGGATRAQTLPVHGDHYTHQAVLELPATGLRSQRRPAAHWTWDEQRPRFIGEELFAAGINPAYAYFGGEEVFQGKAGNRPAVGKAMQMISQGYRWFGIAACDFCQQPSDADGPSTTAGRPGPCWCASGTGRSPPARRRHAPFGIFNDTRFADPLTFTWTLVLDGRKSPRNDGAHVPPGENEKFDVELPIPAADQRQEGEWMLTLSAGGHGGLPRRQGGLGAAPARPP